MPASQCATTWQWPDMQKGLWGLAPKYIPCRIGRRAARRTLSHDTDMIFLRNCLPTNPFIYLFFYVTIASLCKVGSTKGRTHVSRATGSLSIRRIKVPSRVPLTEFVPQQGCCLTCLRRKRRLSYVPAEARLAINIKCVLDGCHVLAANGLAGLM